MPTPVVMPQMGESVAEGTIVRWIKSVGDAVERDEPLFEISTDKVDAEIPAPVAGVLVEIKVRQGETVAVDSVVATIGSAEEALAAAGAPPAAAAAGDGGAGDAQPAVTGAAAARGSGEQARQRPSPLVRRLARLHGVDVSTVPGSNATVDAGSTGVKLCPLPVPITPPNSSGSPPGVAVSWTVSSSTLIT